MPRRIPLPDLGWSNPSLPAARADGVAGDYRFVWRPRWLLGHLLVIAVAVTMVLLGRWQWHTAHVRDGDLQNYAYAIQWWIFTVFAFGMWGRIVRDQARAHASTPPPAVHSESPAPVAYRRYVMPQTTSAPPRVDDVLDDYNAYLAGLSGQTGVAARFVPDAERR